MAISCCIVSPEFHYGSEPDMSIAISPALEYQIEGVSLDTQTQTLRIDLANPRTIFVKGHNTETGKDKLYMLRVTHAGGLVLQ